MLMQRCIARKDNGRNAFHVFTEEMNAQLVERLMSEHALRCALSA